MRTLAAAGGHAASGWQHTRPPPVIRLSPDFPETEEVTGSIPVRPPALPAETPASARPFSRPGDYPGNYRPRFSHRGRPTNGTLQRPLSITICPADCRLAHIRSRQNGRGRSYSVDRKPSLRSESRSRPNDSCFSALQRPHSAGRCPAAATSTHAAGDPLGLQASISTMPTSIRQYWPDNIAITLTLTLQPSTGTRARHDRLASSRSQSD